MTSGRRESAGMRSIQWIDRREERLRPGHRLACGGWRPIRGEAGGPTPRYADQPGATTSSQVVMIEGTVVAPARIS